jgi:hypothetical protein
MERAAARERMIEVGAQIAAMRTIVAELHVKLHNAEAGLAKAEAEFDRLLGTNPDAVLTAETAKASPPRVLGVSIPTYEGGLNDQIVALFKANVMRSFTADEVVAFLNQANGRTEPVKQDSVYAALSRLVSDESAVIVRLERGLYRAKLQRRPLSESPNRPMDGNH